MKDMALHTFILSKPRFYVLQIGSQIRCWSQKSEDRLRIEWLRAVGELRKAAAKLLEGLGGERELTSEIAQILRMVYQAGWFRRPDTHASNAVHILIHGSDAPTIQNYFAREDTYRQHFDKIFNLAVICVNPGNDPLQIGESFCEFGKFLLKSCVWDEVLHSIQAADDCISTITISLTLRNAVPCINIFNFPQRNAQPDPKQSFTCMAIQYLLEEMETQSPPNGVMHLPRSLCNDPSSVPSLLSRTCATTSITAWREEQWVTEWHPPQRGQASAHLAQHWFLSSLDHRRQSSAS